MSYSPPSPHGGPASSPPEMGTTGTPNTFYSPELTRNVNGNARGQPSAVAAHETVVVSSEQRLSLQPAARTTPKFVDDVDREHTDFISRYLSITSFPNGMVAGEDPEAEVQAVQGRMKEYLAFVLSVPLYSHGCNIRFDSLRDACEAKYVLECLGYGTEYMSPYEFAVAKSQDTAAVNDYEGQINISICIKPFSQFTHSGLHVIADNVHDMASSFGNVREIEHAATDEARGILHYRIEFQSIDAANRAIASIASYPPWGEATVPWAWQTYSVAPWVGRPRNDSPTSKTPQKDDQGRLVGFLHQPQRLIDHYVRHPADQQNKVQRDRIVQGTDVRTTVMLRNIPNKLDWLTLKALLDKVCFGAYDFVYLRIDFKSACNVGYAFINFTDMKGLLRMVDELEHRTWNGYRSAKAAEISYATIQGKEALIQKFRNSSVMQETPFCRPRIFRSEQDATAAGNLRLTGTELEFPPPDNPAKLQRSMDSARTVGLYPPHSSGTTNDHRNRASVYDRGTPRDLVQSANMMPTSQSQYSTPFSYQNVPAHVKRMIEFWYKQTYASDHHCAIPFDFIPASFIAQYFAMTPYAANVNGANSQNPGVIGRPLVAQHGRNLRSGPVYPAGPTRRHGSYRHQGF